jgi:serine/threonine protein kinase
MVKSKSRNRKDRVDTAAFPFKDQPAATLPDFVSLLRSPLVSTPLPSNFSVEKEADHLKSLWQRGPDFQRYTFAGFIHAGGSGMVFKVKKEGAATFEAIKIARRHLFDQTGLPQDAATTLSPVSESELSALVQLSHPNVVRLYSTVTVDGVLVAISTTFVDEPLTLDEYLRTTLEKAPRKGPHPFSPERLERACLFLLQRCEEIASALAHMHGMEMYHFDLKPANILISHKTQTAMLTDMGSCVNARKHPAGKEIRVHFTWSYAHPSLREIIHNPSGISGGGLKASASIKNDELAKYDLYSFGKTLQQALAVLDAEFEERCYSSYSFRFLHLVACLLLDGRNSPATVPDSRKRISEQDGLAFVSDTAMHYPVRLFALHRIRSAKELVERLKRHSREYSWSASVPELDPWQAEIINTGTDTSAPFTKRVAAVFNHPALRRLKSEPQLGWIREVYPGATHTRWVHTLGVFDSLVAMYTALLADPEVPTFRVLTDRLDIEHALVAAILHDLGQTSFAHDFETTSTFLPHENFLPRLLDETVWGKTMRQTIHEHWPEIDFSRVMHILRVHKTSTHGEVRPIDGVASDGVNGPIDADKLDYLLRDSIACRVAYGLGMDRDRLVRALTVSAHVVSDGGCRMTIAYKAKGRPAVESMLLARYQMYLAVYWHHAFRAIQAMFGHAVIETFAQKDNQDRFRYRGVNLNSKQIQDLFYYRIVCREEWPKVAKTALGDVSPPPFLLEPAPAVVSLEPAIEFAWRFASEPIRRLLLRLAHRTVYKRVFDFRMGELGERADYSLMRQEFIGTQRTRHAARIQEYLFNKIDSRIRERGKRAVTQSESAARERLQELTSEPTPLVVIDFPIRGLPEEDNLPMEIGDPQRKYFSMPARADAYGTSVFHQVRRLQIQNAAVRVFAASEFHELIVRYLNADDVRACVAEAIPQLRPVTGS